jgi:hypothetical protein
MGEKGSWLIDSPHLTSHIICRVAVPVRFVQAKEGGCGVLRDFKVWGWECRPALSRDAF